MADVPVRFHPVADLDGKRQGGAGLDVGSEVAMTVTIYGDPVSGNCLKVKWVADLLGITSRWETVSVMSGAAKSPEFIKLNPVGKVPLIELEDGTLLSESNAIILYLAEGSALVPPTAIHRAVMYQWMFWEQYSHEPYIAVRRFQLAYQKRSVEDLDPNLLERGSEALRLMDVTLKRSRFMVSDELSLADVALVAYTRMAEEGGFHLGDYPSVVTWIADTEALLNIGRYHP